VELLSRRTAPAGEFVIRDKTRTVPQRAADYLNRLHAVTREAAAWAAFRQGAGFAKSFGTIFLFAVIA
jgi:hypothetical protein